MVTAIFERAFPNGNYPNYVGDPASPTGSSKWSSAGAVDKMYYVNQIKLSNPEENDYTWRIVLAFSAVPAACTMYFRLHMAETPRFTLHVLRNASAMTNGKSP